MVLVTKIWRLDTLIAIGCFAFKTCQWTLLGNMWIDIHIYIHTYTYVYMHFVFMFESSLHIIGNMLEFYMY